MIAKRPPGTHLEGYWEFPGGKVESQETLQDCLVREIGEELGMEVLPEDFVLSVHHDYGTKIVSLHVFSCSVLSGEPRPLQGQDIQWVGPRELKQFPFPPPDEKVVEYLLGGKA